MTRDLRLSVFWRTSVVIIAGARLVCSQAPSEEEQLYLRSILPLIQERKWGEAESRFKEGLAQFPRSALLANALGMVYEQEGKEGMAAGEYEKALEWLPSFTAARIHLAAIYGKQGNCAKASELYNGCSRCYVRC